MSTPARISEQGKGMDPVQLILQLGTGYMPAAALYSAAKLGIADLLAAGPKSVAELAAEAGAQEDALYRLLRALSSVGVFSEVLSRTFALTPAAELLRSDRADSLRDAVLWFADRTHFETYPEMLHAIKTGDTVVEKVYGEACFDYFAKNKEVGEVFNAAMTSFSSMSVPAVLEAYDFSWLEGKTLVDIAGGHGYLLGEILRKYPSVRGVLFDLEHVASGANRIFAQAGVANRASVIAGDFFKEVPPANGYVLKHIIHDWDDARSLDILRNIHRAAEPKARLVVLDAVIAPGNEPHFAKWLDLEMLLLPGGRERTQEEFARLFERGGFRLTRVVPTKSPVSVIEAEKLS
jgi:hypothetical protein